MSFRSALLLALIFPALASPALARPDATRMTCAQAQKLVRDNGRIVVTTGRHTYDLVRASRLECSYPETDVPAQVRTRDGVQCTIGYTCQRGGGFNFRD